MVAIIENWTSGTGDGRDRRSFFSVGETLQLNAVFLTERPADTRVMIAFLIDGALNWGSRNDAHSFDVVFRPQVLMQAFFTVGPSAQHASARLEITAVPDSVRWRGRQGEVEAAQGRDIRYIFSPGLYDFRASVELGDVDTGLSFDFSQPVTYRIVS